MPVKPGYAVTVLLTLTLAACFIPEKFNVDIVIKGNEGYHFKYDGTLAFGPLIADLQQGKKENKEEAQELGQEIIQANKEPGYKTFDYKGKGRYKTHFEKEGSFDTPFSFPNLEKSDFFSIKRLENGNIEIKGNELDEKSLADIKKLNISIDGKISVTVKDGEVLETNADSKPLFGMFGSYGWAIKNFKDSHIYMIVKPNS